MANFTNKALEWKKNMSRLFSGFKITSGGEDVALFDQLMTYYQQNGLYEDLMAASYYLDIYHEPMKPLRNPAHRSVEFYVAKLMPGVLPDSLPILTDNAGIVEPIQQVWKWSNLSERKASVLRHYGVYGNVFIHPVTSEEMDRVYLQFIDPMYLTDFTKDDRGYILTARVDVPVDENKLHTEYWTDSEVFMWEHARSTTTKIEDLGEPYYSAYLSEFGIDFCPFVHAQFRDVGERWGWGCFQHALDKIDECNRMATRLHQMIFRYDKPIWALMANASDAQGRPLPPPRVGSSDKLELEDDSLIKLPGVSSLNPLIPNVNYAALMQVVQEQMKEIEKDLPELAYYDLRNRNDLSGRAVRLLLGDSIDRAEEARANFESGLIRAEKMALTMGEYLGLFQNVGDYDSGDLDHSFQKREIFPVGSAEKAATFALLGKSGMSLEGAMRLAGYTDDEIASAQPAEPAQPPVVENVPPQVEMPVQMAEQIDLMTQN